MKLRTLFFSIAALALFGQAEDAVPKPPKPQVQFTTTLGSFTVELDPDAAPKTVANFLEYVESDFYQGTTFHRVIKTFMIQGGSPAAADGSTKTLRSPVVNEAKQASEKGLKNVRGAIAMARTSNPDSATSQFFINVVDNVRLDYPNPDGAGYCVFGHVVEGMETVDNIRNVETAPGDRPVTAVVITSAKLLDADARRPVAANQAQ